MAARIVWAKSATQSYEEILQFLLQLWGVEMAVRFEALVEEIQSKLSLHPQLGASTDAIIGARKFVLHENTTLFYRYDETLDLIELVRFFDTRQNPSKLSR